MTAGTVTEFDRALALVDSAPDVALAELGAGWRFGTAMHGGLLLAVAAAAAGRRIRAEGRPGDPLSISAHFLSAAVAGPAELRTEVVRLGRTLSTAAVSLAQRVDGVDVERVRALVTVTDLERLDADVRLQPEPPAMPPPEQCLPCPAFLEDATLWDRVEIRLDPATAGWVRGEPGHRPHHQGWARFTDGRDPDPLALLLICDAMPNTVAALGIPGYVPTLELTAHVRGVPSPGWLRFTQTTRNYSAGMIEEDAEIFDATGRMVLQSRQLARAPRTGPHHSTTRSAR
ncbi:thioesterase family protein [Cryptosporangium aurantiacum]|uniref:Acyl-CoA thioesterase n=1 Tax=Cryptosporangium aurantiacum TaxID=134849 RepID=A0A1M7R446_9ACTN|nr:thioesterase family protein [Cryptosporangium aurantiacum]SHN39779.1 Acyl-CoA thioesterase [Cryptosporangium aurantiacum]